MTLRILLSSLIFWLGLCIKLPLAGGHALWIRSHKKQRWIESLQQLGGSGEAPAAKCCFVSRSWSLKLEMFQELESNRKWWIFSCTILCTYLRVSECTIYQLSLVSHRELCQSAPGQELAVTKTMLGLAWTQKAANFVETWHSSYNVTIWWQDFVRQLSLMKRMSEQLRAAATVGPETNLSLTLSLPHSR